MHPGDRPLKNDTACFLRRLVVHRVLVVAAAMVSMFMVTIETTIVSAIIPVSATQTELSQSQRWVVLAFLLGQTAMIVVSGRLADRHGRKPVMLLGTGVFIAGSVLAGAAWSLSFPIKAQDHRIDQLMLLAPHCS